MFGWPRLWGWGLGLSRYPRNVRCQGEGKSLVGWLSGRRVTCEVLITTSGLVNQRPPTLCVCCCVAVETCRSGFVLMAVLQIVLGSWRAQSRASDSIVHWSVLVYCSCSYSWKMKVNLFVAIDCPGGSLTNLNLVVNSKGNKIVCGEYVDSTIISIIAKILLKLPNWFPCQLFWLYSVQV